jgi:hypothetical protein
MVPDQCKNEDATTYAEAKAKYVEEGVIAVFVKFAKDEFQIVL